MTLRIQRRSVILIDDAVAGYIEDAVVDVVGSLTLAFEIIPNQAIVGRP